MNYQLNVYAAPWSSNAQADALAFAAALADSDHRLVRVFFFMDAVYSGLSTQAPSADEPDWRQRWIDLQQQTQCELLLCIAASANRGLLNDTEAQRQAKPIATVEAPFELVGLGQWAAGFGDCDRVVSFR
ncbi:sulfurtransferase complex subunit TusD [Saccharospirillum mangrovi]|uniref:sulfurtransferase complex subunit TusD n=1 Tax=Saccharospirillum mangrovi TaxID=2161747 RepID=UPI000D352DFE|nr:sulfurtransferase complex subunit TusD [Saccharospirillum mangrovi]